MWTPGNNKRLWPRVVVAELPLWLQLRPLRAAHPAVHLHLPSLRVVVRANPAAEAGRMTPLF
jgi:hypothetical protein